MDHPPSLEILVAHPSYAERVVRAELDLRNQGLADSLRGSPSASFRGYRLERRAALVPMIGPLVPRGPVGLAAYGLTSYEGLRSELRRAADDDEVDAIILMIDSPGGYVTGVDATADAILAARARKPVIAVAEGQVASAAYWLASQCDLVVVSAFSDVGSIGVIRTHIDVSRALDRAGITVTVLHAGARKADGSPYAPLPDHVQDETMADLERTREAFARAVVAGRARIGLDMAAVLATEAASFDGATAVAMGLADRVGTLEQVLSKLPRLTAGIVPLARSARLALVPADALALSIEEPIGAPSLDLPSAAIERPVPISQASEAPVLAVGETERERLSRIFAHPMASDERYRTLVHEIAFGSTSTEEVVRNLDVMAEISADAHRGRGPTLDEEMAADQQPILGGDGGPSWASLSAMERGAVEAARILGKDASIALARVRGGAVAPNATISSERLASVPSASDRLRAKLFGGVER